MRKIITVSREFGSGGREIGKRLSECLGLNYYDSEIVKALSEETKLDENYLNDKLENNFNYMTSIAHSFSRLPMEYDPAMLLAKQHNIIKNIVKDNDCIIIGRGADAVLSALKPFKIFVYADMDAKIARCKERMADGENLTDKELEKKIKSIDKSRKSIHDLYSSYTWGDKSAYNLCLNTTGINVKNVVPAVAQIINDYFENLS